MLKKSQFANLSPTKLSRYTVFILATSLKVTKPLQMYAHNLTIITLNLAVLGIR